MHQSNEVERVFDKSSLRSAKRTNKNNKKYVDSEDGSQDQKDSGYEQTHSRSRDKKPKPSSNSNSQRQAKHVGKKQQTQKKGKSKKKKQKQVKNEAPSQSFQSKQSSSGSSSEQSSEFDSKRNRRQPEPPRQREVLKFKRQALPAETRPKEVLIEKPHVHDPELDKSMQKILSNIAKQIRPKSKKKLPNHSFLPESTQGKVFSKDLFPYKSDSQYRISSSKLLNSPFVPPSLRQRQPLGQNFQITPRLEQFQMSLQQLPLRGFQIKGEKHEAAQPKQLVSERIDETDQSQQNVEIVESTKLKRDKEMQLLSWIQQINRNKSQSRQQTIDTAGSKLEVFFNKSGVEQFLGNLIRK